MVIEISRFHLEKNSFKTEKQFAIFRKWFWLLCRPRVVFRNCFFFNFAFIVELLFSKVGFGYFDGNITVRKSVIFF
jgi:hypothetical protein